jgi:hypothetical protein
MTKFGWIGSMNQDISFCGVWQAPGLPTSFPDMLKPGGKELIFGSAGPAAISHQHPLILKNVVGANVRVISGYQGQKQVNLAMQRGEVHGAPWPARVDQGTVAAGRRPAGRSCRWGRRFQRVRPGTMFDSEDDDDRKVPEFHFGDQPVARSRYANLPPIGWRRPHGALVTMKDPEFWLTPRNSIWHRCRDRR